MQNCTNRIIVIEKIGFYVLCYKPLTNPHRKYCADRHKNKSFLRYKVRRAQSVVNFQGNISHSVWK